jgi:heat shock protein HslJ
VSGSDGCNRFSTGYTLDGGQLEIDPSGATTLAACPPPIMEQAAAFMKALSVVRTAKLDGTTLSLIDESGTTQATFTAQRTSLTDTSWQVSSINNGKGGVTGVREGTALTLNFGADGKLSGSAGCNRFQATYETEGNTITIGPAAATRRMCPEPVMEQENAFLKALTGTLTTRFEGDRVELRTEAGSLMVSAKRVEGS